MFELRGDSQISIRSYGEADAPSLFAAVEANRAHLDAWLPWVEHTRSVDDAREFIRSTARRWADNLGFQGGIFANEELTGGIGCRPIDWTNRKVEIGYWLAASAQGRGIVTSAARLLIGHCFLEWKLNRVEIRCAAGNARSCAIAERLGFTFEGTQREAQWLHGKGMDLRLYSLLAREWAAA